MSNKFIDSIKHVIIEDDDPRSQGKGQAHPQLHSEASPPGAGPVAASTENASYHPASTPPMTEETEHVYQRILRRLILILRRSRPRSTSISIRSRRFLRWTNAPASRPR